ncbi:hypothetical protein MTR67_019961 [Solanum verrucosum]|uniref:F-box domain-containing protein n=1 Tax=Solanum verrucosum TaxID=315347 RepID=A0AAF0QTW8_SOLVR|nr:hypothetical protein MTR67_019961 [Solanum verrucosum]
MDGHRPLPEDVVIDILLRLPVESLLRFKCVRKDWCTLIRSPSFIEKHFHHKNNCARLLVCNLKVAREVHPIVKSVAFSLLPKEIVPGVTPEQKILLQLPRITHFMCVAGPVDGLFLVQKKFYGDDVCLGLWNPATKEFRTLPPAPFEIEGFFTNHDHQFGLGFDLLTQDYKVVWIRVFWDMPGQGANNRVYACVYSSCNNSWKHLTPEFPPSSTLSAPLDATYLNRVYYWLCRGLDDIYTIRSFDMGSEQFGEIQVPETSQLVLYDPTTRRVTDLGFQLDLFIAGCWVFNYKESLVPIKRGNETQGEDNAVEQIEHYFYTIPMDEASS